MNDLTRPIIGIENRTAQEVFDIMCDRLRAASITPPAPERSKEEVGVKDQLLAALERVKYIPGDHPVVPNKYISFHNEIANIAAALEPASHKGEAVAVAWHHRLIHDLGYDFDSEVTESAGHPFGKAGRDFPGTYRIVTAPLYASPAPLPVGEEEALLALIREEAGKDNSPLGRSDSLAIRRIRTALGLDPHSGAALAKPREQG